jgi:hypothetical protein
VRRRREMIRDGCDPSGLLTKDLTTAFAGSHRPPRLAPQASRARNRCNLPFDGECKRGVYDAWP